MLYGRFFVFSFTQANMETHIAFFLKTGCGLDRASWGFRVRRVGGFIFRTSHSALLRSA